MPAELPRGGSAAAAAPGEAVAASNATVMITREQAIRHMVLFELRFECDSIVDQPNTEGLTVVVANLAETPSDFDLVPELPDFGDQPDVMEGDQPSGFDERSVHLEILLDSVVRMVAIDEKEIDATLADQFRDPRPHGWVV